MSGIYSLVNDSGQLRYCPDKHSYNFGGLVLDDDVALYKTAYEESSNTFVSGELDALNTLVLALKLSGVWTKYAFLWVCPAAPSNLTGASLYLKSYGSVDRLTFTNFTTGDITVDGIKGNGSSKHADTGINASLVFDTSTLSIGLHCSSVIDGVGNHSDFAWNTAGQGYSGLALGGSSGGIYVNNSLVSFSKPAQKGLYIGSLSGTTLVADRNTSTLASNTISAPSAVPSINMYLWAFNNAGSGAADWSDLRHSMAFTLDHAVFSTTERDAQSNAYSAYCAAIGRNF